MNENTRPAIAEFLGTFILVFIGAGAGALAGGDSGIIRVALAHGFALMVIIYMLGGVSGAHVNPAVTLGIAMAGKITWPRAIQYWVAQVAGCIVAAFALKFCLGGAVGNLGATQLAAGVSVTQGVVIEAILTFLLMTAVMVSGVFGKNGSHAAIAIGSVLIMDILMGGALTGASMNPARTLGPALAIGDFSNFWVYLVGPGAGAIGGALFAKALYPKD